MNPKISVVMSVFNGESYLAEAIESILDQTFTDFEFIIINDGSTDTSSDILQDYAQQDPRIRLIMFDENIGLASALNHGIHQAQGEYIARMDCDDISQSSRLQQQVDYLDAHPEVCLLGAQMMVVDKDKNPLFVFEVPPQHSLIIWNLFFGRTFAHPSVMMRRGVVLRVGGYDESISAAQDIDLWSRMIGQGRFANLPEQLVYYRTHEQATSIQKSDQQGTILRLTYKRLLMQLWGDVVLDTTLTRFHKIRSGRLQFLKRDYEPIKVDLQRLAESLLAKGWILPDEKYLIDADINRLLEVIKPKHTGFWGRVLGKLKL